MELFHGTTRRSAQQIAMYDPNPQVAEIARKLSAREGYHVLKPRWN